MAKKQVVAKVKMLLPGGQATLAPPVGPSLSPHQVNIGEFVKRFNDRTRDAQGTPTPVVVTVYRDRSYDFITKSPPAAVLLKRAADIAKGSGTPNKEKVGRVTRAQVLEIAKTKQQDLNAKSLEAAMRIVAGTARSMGIEIAD